MDDLRFDGQAVVVTGGCRGIGRAIAQRFAEAGAHVLVCCRNEPESLPEGVAFFAADVREPEQVDAVVDSCVQRFGRFDVLVNNAGGSPPADSATASPRFTAGIIALNLTAPHRHPPSWVMIDSAVTTSSRGAASSPRLEGCGLAGGLALRDGRSRGLLRVRG